MSELRRATLVIDVVGSAIQRLVQVKALMAEIDGKKITIQGVNAKAVESSLKALQLGVADTARASQTAGRSLSNAFSDTDSLKSFIDLTERLNGYTQEASKPKRDFYVPRNALAGFVQLTGQVNAYTRASTTAAKISPVTPEAARNFEDLVAQMDSYEQRAINTTNVTGALTRIFTESGAALGNLNNFLVQHRAQLAATGAALTAFAGFSFVKALNVGQTREELQRYAEAKNWDTEALQKWLAANRDIPGTSQRTLTAIANMDRAYAGSTGQLIREADTVAKFWAINSDTLAQKGIKNQEQFMAALMSGDEKQFADLIQLDIADVSAMWDDAAKDVYRAKGWFDEAEIQKRAVFLALEHKMGQEVGKNADALKNAKPTWNDFLATIDDIQLGIGNALIPTLVYLAQGLKGVGDALLSIPGGSNLAALGLIVGIVAFSVATFFAILGGGLGGLITFIGLLKKAELGILAYRIATTIAAAAQWGLNAAMVANPIGVVVIALTALLVIIGYVLYKTGYLQKAFEYLKAAAQGAFDILSKQGAGGLLKFFFMALFPPAILGKLLEPILGPILDSLGVERTISDTLTSLFNLWKNFIAWLWGGIDFIIKGIKYLTGIGADEDDRTLIKDLKTAIWGKEEVKKEGQAEKAAEFGISGWGTVNEKPAVKVIYRELGDSVRNTPEWDEIMEKTGDKSRLYGPDWMKFAQEYPELAALFTRGGDVLVPMEHLSDYNITSAMLPPRPKEVMKGNVVESFNEAWAGQAEENAKAMEEAEEKGVPVTSITGNDWSVWNSLGTIYEGGKNYLGFDSGGEIFRSGGAVIHQGEEVVPPAQAKTGPGAIAQAIEALKLQQSRSSTITMPPVNVNIYNPSLPNQAAVTQLKFELERHVQEVVARTIRPYTR